MQGHPPWHYGTMAILTMLKMSVERMTPTAQIGLAPFGFSSQSIALDFRNPLSNLQTF